MYFLRLTFNNVLSDRYYLSYDKLFKKKKRNNNIINILKGKKMKEKPISESLLLIKMLGLPVCHITDFQSSFFGISRVSWSRSESQILQLKARIFYFEFQWRLGYHILSWKSLFLDCDQSLHNLFFRKSTLLLEMFQVKTFEGKIRISFPHCTSLLPPVLQAGFPWEIEKVHKSFVLIWRRLMTLKSQIDLGDLKVLWYIYIFYLQAEYTRFE